MVVGEPTLMGGEFGDEDERLITRLENQQFEPNGAEEEDNQGFQNSPSLQSSPWGQEKSKTPQSTGGGGGGPGPGGPGQQPPVSSQGEEPKTE